MKQKIKIAGYQNLSTVDYPGNIASAVFLQGCNFKCPYCYNPDLVTSLEKYSVQEEDFFRMLELRKRMIEAVVVTGGEPTIYEDLSGFIKEIKNQGFKVKLDTNGSNPNHLEKLLEQNLLDYIAIDIKTSLENYDKVSESKDMGTTVYESIKLVMTSAVPYEFRTTCVPGIVFADDFHSIKEKTKGAQKYCLQQFKPLKTYDESFQKIKPYTKEEIYAFKEILKGYVKSVETRGL